MQANNNKAVAQFAQPAAPAMAHPAPEMAHPAPAMAHPAPAMAYPQQVVMLPQKQEVHLISTGFMLRKGIQFSRQYPAVLHQHLTQQALFQEVAAAEQVVAKQMSGSLHPMIFGGGFLVGMLCFIFGGFASVNSFGSNRTGIYIGIVICLASMVGMIASSVHRSSKMRQGLAQLEMHFANNVTPKYPALTWVLGYDQVLTNHSSSTDHHHSRNELRVSNRPKITIQVDPLTAAHVNYAMP
jgi:hypothetical protein